MIERVLCNVLVSVAWCGMAIGSECGVEQLNDSSFNNDPNLGPPVTLSSWSGDVANSVGSSLGIVPFEGPRMLRFHVTSSGDPSFVTASSEVWQLIDVADFGYPPGACLPLTIRGSFWANRVEGDSETDTMFSAIVAAYQGVPSQFPQLWRTGELAQATVYTGTDADVLTWEHVSVDFEVPLTADFVVFRVAADENIMNDANNPEFDGHFADMASLEVVAAKGDCDCDFDIDVVDFDALSGCLLGPAISRPVACECSDFDHDDDVDLGDFGRFQAEYCP